MTGIVPFIAIRPIMRRKVIMQWYSERGSQTAPRHSDREQGKWMVSYNDCDFIRELYAGYFITAVTRINNLAQRYEGGCEFQRSLLPIMILERGSG